MPQRSVRSGMLLAALLLGTAGSCGSAWAYDDGYQNVFSSVLTAVGVMPPEKTPEIDYRERAPLVLPPKKDLGAPQVPGANRTAAWPQDPDVIARRRQNEEDNAPIASLFDKRSEQGRVDTKQEMLRHRAATTGPEPDATGCGSIDHSDAHCRLSVEQMRKQDARYRADNGGGAAKDQVTAGVEPDRVYLTQPPKGYLKATKTVRATAEAPYVKRDESSPLSALIERPHVDEPDSPNQ